ncbi:MAG: sodium transport system permease protein [Clostridiales bacterium]|jgi:sodium transport system permease protein|nr:sodium transport system permease protein [Clostridiales bacterium]MDK2934227.1 sodium transport system permease protein [Clostridiales bacterium]
MNWKYVWIVLKKELKDLFRDKKTIISSILLPALLFPVLMFLLVKGGQATAKKAVENIKIVVQSEANINDIKDFLQKEILNTSKEKIQIVNIKNAEEALKDDDIRAILYFEKDFLTDIHAEKTGKVTIIYNTTSSKSEIVANKISQLLKEYKERLIYQRITSRGIDVSILEGIHITKKGIENQIDQTAWLKKMLSFIIPLFLVLYPIAGGIPAATDLVAGEKERGTLEPLLTTQPNRLFIITGKLITVTIFSMISVVAYFSGMLFLGFILPKEILQTLVYSKTFIAPLSILLMIIIGVLLAVMAAALLLTISTFARSFKEAQSYMTPLIFASMIPTYMVMMWDVSDFKVIHFLIPILNAVALIKELIINAEIIWTHVVLTIGSTLLFVILALIYCVKMFNKEEVLFRS